MIHQTYFTCRPADIELTIDIADLEEKVEFDKSIDQMRMAEKDFHSRMPRILQVSEWVA